MASKITYIKTEDFETRRVLGSSNSECTLNNLFFRKSDAFSHHQIQEVLDICNKYNGFNINTLVVKSQDILTIWIEEKSKNTQFESSENKHQEANRQTQFVNQPLPTKKVTKKYRGQVYEEEVVDWAAVQQMSQQNKPTRKYRGQYID